MKIDLKLIASFVLGAAIAYGYCFVSTSYIVAKMQGQVEVFGQFCKPQLEQSGIIAKDKK